jgi:triosephosphate isomerase
MVKIENTFRDERRPLLAGNWKMNGIRANLGELAAIDRAAGAIPGADVLLCVPFPLLCAAAAKAQHAAIGAQDCHAEAHGAFTGGVSAEMLLDAGAQWVLVGHSECRHALRLGDDDVARKLAAALPSLRPILCVGERKRGSAEAAAHAVAAQLLECLPVACDPARLTVAYEPVWAIGAGETPGIVHITQVHAALRAALEHRFGRAGARVRILYGGSVTRSNAGAIAAVEHVDGLLVGGASLKAETFVPILEQFAR